MKKAFFFCMFIIAGICLEAQELDIIVDVSAGSGFQAGVGAKRTEWNTAPLFTDYEVMINTDNDPFFEYGMSMFVPLTNGRMALAFVPKIKLKKKFSERFELYLSGGAAVFVAGVDLYGVHVEPGFRTKIIKFLDFFAEMNVGLYPLGKDIPELSGTESGMVSQLNIAVGISLVF